MMFTPTEQQRTAIETTGKNLCVDAAAGSGKTAVLVHRIVHLLRKDVSLRRIVAITFTRKAAAEMRERLRREIHRAADPADPRSMTKWRQLELELESARITTIDAFCAGLLRENALHLGLDPDFALLADAEGEILRAEVAGRAIEALLEAGDAAAHRLGAEFGVFHLNGAIERALGAPAEMERACARYDGLNAEALAKRWRDDTDALLGTRFKKLAADPRLGLMLRELEGLDGACGDPADARERVRVAARDSLRTVLALENAAAVNSALVQLTQFDLRQRSRKNWSSPEAFNEVARIVKDARELAERWAIEMIDPADEARAVQLTLDLLHVYRHAAAAYAKAKTARTALDFAELLRRTFDMIAERPELRHRVAAGAHHLLIDEFQDTNHAQLELARQIAGLGAAVGAELFVVGDAKQSIYRFRNAEVDVFAKARDLVDETLYLDENFRSVPEIIAFINHFFARSGLLQDVEAEFHPLRATRPPANGPRVEFLVPETITTGGGNAAGAEVYREAEARMIAARVAQMCGPDGVDVFDKATKQPRRAQYGDIALLFRKGTNFETYDAALRDAGIPSIVAEGSGFYARQEVLDLHNLFTAALDPWNEFALAAFLRGPLGGLRDDTLMELTRAQGLADAFANGAAPRDDAEAKRLGSARGLLRDIWAWREMPLPTLVRFVLARTGFEAILLPQIHGVQKAGNLRKLVDVAESFSHTGRASLHAFTSYLATIAQRDPREGDAELATDALGAVTLMTVHKAKGLEFPVAIVADTGAKRGTGRTARLFHAHMQYGLAAVVHDTRGAMVKPPLAQLVHAIDAEEQDAEEARVLYVAATRARDFLLFSMPPKPIAGTWAAHLNATLDIGSQSDGAMLRGEGWEARVLRKTPARNSAEKRRDRREPIDLGALTDRAEPLNAVGAIGDSLPVNAMLDRIFGERAWDQERSTTEGTRDPGGRALGTAVHTLLERWDFGSDPPIASVLRDYCPQISARASAQDALERVVDRLRACALWQRLRDAARVERELSFTWRTAGVTLRGKIDLLIDGELVLDYKTGTFDAARHARYETQLQLYAAAADAAGRPVRSGYVLYLDIGRLEEIEVSKPALADLSRRVHDAVGAA